MDRWISTAWKAFWVGLGASAVLVGQAVLSPAAPAVPAPPAVILQPFAPEAAPAAENRVTRERIPALPVLSRVPARCSTDRCS